jgi:hypothetical protein
LAPPAPTFEVTIQVRNDGGEPLENALIALGPTQGRSDASGSFQATLSAEAKQLLELSVECPEGYRAPERIRPLRLQRVQSLSPTSLHPERIERSVVCTALEHAVVVVVNAAGAEGLPLLVDGTTRGDLDSQGVSHLLLEGPTDTSFDVSIDTSARPALRPENPSLTVSVAEADSIVPFSPELRAPRRPLRRSSGGAQKPARHIPYRVN